MIKVTLRRVRLNQGGYDSNGGYWGVGAPMYWFAYIDPFNNLEHSDHVRAGSSYDAKIKVRAMRPTLKFAFHN